MSILSKEPKKKKIKKEINKQEKVFDPHDLSPAEGRKLFKRTQAFAVDNKSYSWWCVISTVFLFLVTHLLAGLLPTWYLRLPFSVLSALMMVRGFCLYHDYLHGAILQDSKIAKGLFYIYGYLHFTPPSAWNYSHNYHHSHMGESDVVGTGTFSIYSLKKWKKCSKKEKIFYKIENNPLIILFSIVTVFIYSMCIMPFIRNPKKHWDCLLTLVFSGLFITAVIKFAGMTFFIYSILIPAFIGSMIGAYLFYAQHIYEDLKVIDAGDLNYFKAAIGMSSYMKMGRIMNWFTANIGYHHVHHLNHKIPFYNLPRTMAKIPELQTPGMTTLRPQDIYKCLRLKFWDAKQNRMVSGREAKILLAKEGYA